MKKIMILAGGTSTAWHIVNEIEKYYKDIVKVYICDTNPKYLVPSSKKCTKFIKVPNIKDKLYYKTMINILEENKIDILVPLIDFDLEIFSCDNADLKRIGVKSTAPKKDVVKLLSNKYNMSLWLNKIGINTPKVYSIDEISEIEEYILKPKVGFGSRNITKCTGSELNKIYNEDYIIQEVCNSREVTVEIFKNDTLLKTICRERIEVKSGVCTKARIYNDLELHKKIKTIVKNIDFPTSSCIQFMLNSNNEWCVTDINLRLGAGTALVSKIGWQLARASLSIWLETKEDCNSFFCKVNQDRFVVRVFEEIEMI